jgi:hypothetical protein
MSEEEKYATLNVYINTSAKKSLYRRMNFAHASDAVPTFMDT